MPLPVVSWLNKGIVRPKIARQPGQTKRKSRQKRFKPAHTDKQPTGMILHYPRRAVGCPEIMKLCLFEDHHPDRFIFEKIFETLGFESYQIFEDPESGLDVARREQVDVVIIPIHFWGPNYGLEILRRWKQYCVNQPMFIGSTALIQLEDKDLLTKGFDRLCQKPGLFSIVQQKILSWKENPVEIPLLLADCPK